MTCSLARLHFAALCCRFDAQLCHVRIPWDGSWYAVSHQGGLCRVCAGTRTYTHALLLSELADNQTAVLFGPLLHGVIMWHARSKAFPNRQHKANTKVAVQMCFSHQANPYSCRGVRGDIMRAFCVRVCIRTHLPQSHACRLLCSETRYD